MSHRVLSRVGVGSVSWRMSPTAYHTCQEVVVGAGGEGGVVRVTGVKVRDKATVGVGVVAGRHRVSAGTDPVTTRDRVRGATRINPKTTGGV